MRNKNKKVYFVLILVVLFGISVGYAVINRTLNVTGNSEIKQNTWNIYFDNVKVKEGSVTSNLPVIDTTTKSTVNFNVMLNLPGDFYEFTVDVVNSGTIDAMIESITKTPTLTAIQAKYLNYIIEYENGEQITSKQLVSKNSLVRLKVRVEYKKDLTEIDLPTITETLNLGFTLNYFQGDRTGATVKNNGIKIQLIANGSLDDIGTIVTIGSEQFYTIGTEGNNVKLLSMYNLYVAGEYRTNQGVYKEYGDEATGIQDSNILGWVSVSAIRKGVMKFSDTTYWYMYNLKEEYGTSYPAYVYDSNSILYSYVENYKKYLSTLGVNPIEARLISLEELENLGCSKPDCKSAPSWVYSTSYWSGSATYYDELMTVLKDGTFSKASYLSNVGYGCRPVIIISKSLF